MRNMQGQSPHKIFSNKRFEEILLHFSVSTLKKENEDEMLWDIAKNCISQLNLVDCVIYLVDKQRGVLVQKAAYGPKNSRDHIIDNPIEIPLGKGITGQVAQTGVAEIVTDTTKDPRYIADDQIRLSEITVPILLDKEVLGIIDCEHPRAHYFTKQHLRLLTGIANLCAVSIQNLRNNDHIKEEQKKRFLLQQEFLEFKIGAWGNQLNPHFVFNALNAIQHFILLDRKPTALRYLTTFSRLVRFYLAHLGEDTVVLDRETGMLKHYLTLQHLRYQGKFTFEISPHHEGHSAVIIPAFVLQPLLENLIENTVELEGRSFKLKITITPGPVTVLIHIMADGFFNIKDKLQNNTKYREHMLQWQDQIRLMNQVKNYDIKKTAVLKGNQNTILIVLPNLRSRTT